ncbi:proteasome regulatory particle base subunit [Tulasnella sp. 427]|nr:proteasome regulatory particle base subunit [Tulasnella sp. 427]
MGLQEVVRRCVDGMLQYARETRHEKIIRGSAIGVTFIYYGREEEADKMVEQLLADKEPIPRYGGAYALALAYAGTADHAAAKTLLHIAVSNTSDDVRRAAVTCFAFFLVQTPCQVPRLVQFLSGSCNPHVRRGATLALGLSCAGTGSSEAIARIFADKHEDPMATFGAAVAQGLIDAGGRNVTISLQSRAGSKNMGAINCMALLY